MEHDGTEKKRGIDYKGVSKTNGEPLKLERIYGCDKIECNCGSVIRVDGFGRHVRTQKHKKYVATRND